MAESNSEISVDYFIRDIEVLNCLDQLEKSFGKNGERLIVSDVLDREGHQYVNLVQKGGGVLGIALVGYTYILEQMNIRFIRLAGTSAGAINTALMTVIGGEAGTITKEGKPERVVKGDKTQAKSEKILKVICELNFFDLVDGHPVARWIIKNFIKNKDFTTQLNKWITRTLVTLVALPVLDFICLGLQHQFPAVSILTKLLFVVTGFFIMLVTMAIFYLVFLLTRLKDAGFGINPGDFFYDWIKERMKENDVMSVSDLVSKASTPVPDLYLRVDNIEGTKGLEGDVTFIASELVTENKIEFPKMWELFRKDKDELQPAGFVRASMSIPIFFESYFIDAIPCTTDAIKKQWALLDEPDPPSVARFVDGGILSNFPINLFYNPNVVVPRLPAFGIDLDDTTAPAKEPATLEKQKQENIIG
ncbi:MAG: patatin-like phospholipase family protein, partial [Ferruginibacter sp.]